MNLFINDIFIRLYKSGDKPKKEFYDCILDAKKKVIKKTKLTQKPWIKNASIQDIGTVLDTVQYDPAKTLYSVYITTQYYKEAIQFIKKQFNVVKAAGGLVRKKNKFLLIYRLDKWDLPKGKKELRETYPQTAKREVHEECNIDIQLNESICTTWHTYSMKKSRIIKKTNWYTMQLIDDSKMKPCLKEGIKKTRWMNRNEVSSALNNSYRLIQQVFIEYDRMQKS